MPARKILKAPDDTNATTVELGITKHTSVSLPDHSPETDYYTNIAQP
jgi:hypothetical protein